MNIYGVNVSPYSTMSKKSVSLQPVSELLPLCFYRASLQKNHYKTKSAHCPQLLSPLLERLRICELYPLQKRDFWGMTLK